VTLVVVVAVLFAAGAAIALYAWLAPRNAAVPVGVPPPAQMWEASTDWTLQAGEEFAGLSEAARCDLIFAVADLRDERSRGLLVHALDDPSDAVALAAGRALASRGEGEKVAAYAQQHPGPRAQRILDALALLS